MSRSPPRAALRIAHAASWPPDPRGVSLANEKGHGAIEKQGYVDSEAGIEYQNLEAYVPSFVSWPVAPRRLKW